MRHSNVLNNAKPRHATTFYAFICHCVCAVVMSCALAMNANAKDPNAFDDNFKMDLAEYLGAEQTAAYKALYSYSKRQFNGDFEQVLRALGKKTQLTNGEVADTLTLVQPLMRQYVASLRSIQFDGTQPQQKYASFEAEQKKLHQAGVTLPKQVVKHFTEQGEQALFYQQSIQACDTNANGMIDKTSREERICVADRAVAQEKRTYEKKLSELRAENIRLLEEQARLFDEQARLLENTKDERIKNDEQLKKGRYRAERARKKAEEERNKKLEDYLSKGALLAIEKDIKLNQRLNKGVQEYNAQVQGYERSKQRVEREKQGYERAKRELNEQVQKMIDSVE